VTSPLGTAQDADDDAFVAAYLARLGIQTGRQADVTRLREIHAAHVERVPFENLSIHLGEPLSLETVALADKILRRGRGGFCYELNGLFARLLEHLGYRVTLLGARVWDGEAFGPPLDHLVLAVTTVDDEETWVADVGFGNHSLYPLRWVEDVEQDDPGGVFRLQRTGDDWDLYRNSAVQYRIEAHPRMLRDFDAMCWYHQTCPQSHFTRSLVCTRRSGEGRVTLSDRRLIITTASGKTETELIDDRLVLDTYRTAFGIELEQIPNLPLHAEPG
jgi:N-hydroxyarylamine O-acetyltransferase